MSTKASIEISIPLDIPDVELLSTCGPTAEREVDLVNNNRQQVAEVKSVTTDSKSRRFSQ